MRVAGFAVMAMLLSTAARPGVGATIEERVAEHGEAVRARLEEDFRKAGVPYPPARLALLGFKQERTLELHGADANGRFQFIRAYPVLAASGALGPKLRQGDHQVPEGIYAVESLNPNSRFHLALRLDYPSAADRAQAEHEGRTDLGGDIMIHGNAVSTGCLAMGDRAAEDLFILAAATGIANITVIVTPVDFRKAALPESFTPPPWVGERYRAIKAALTEYPPNS